MSWPASIAIWFLFFTLSLFLVLPFGNRTAGEAGVTPVPGAAESAPLNPRIWQKFAAAVVLATVIFLAYRLNYSAGWITLDDIPGWADRGPQLRR